MNLFEYIKSKNLTFEQFAKKASITSRTLYNIRDNQFDIRLKTIIKIYIATNAEIDIRDFLISHLAKIGEKEKRKRAYRKRVERLKIHG